MIHLPVTTKERFAEIVETLISDAGVTFGSPHEKGFESSALKTENKSFAMRCEGRFVVKLPGKRVVALITSGDGIRFGSGAGRLTKKWVSVEPTSESRVVVPGERGEDICGVQTTLRGLSSQRKQRAAMQDSSDAREGSPRTLQGARECV